MIKSIMLILFLGILLGKLFSKIKLPALLGMIIAGVIVGPYGLNLLDKTIMASSGDIRKIALIIILLRAGLGINKQLLKKVGKVSIKMSAIPCLCEGAVLLFISHKLLHLPILQAGMLAFIIAAVSPAVVVPAMLSLKERKLGTKKGIPIVILAGSSIDDIFAITIFTVFLGMSSNSGQSIGMQLMKIPVEIIGGILFGIISGYILEKIYNNFESRITELEKLAVLLITAFFLVVIGDLIHVSGLLSVMTLGFILLEKCEKTAKRLESQLNKIWYFAQVFLFALIGAAVNIPVAVNAGIIGIVVILIGLIGRTIGVFIALAGSNLNRKERLFCAIAYSPKATVQAAIGAIPFQMGIPNGELILAISVLAIILTAPLGAIAINSSAPKLLEDNSNDEIEVA
ncbi:cation:proton antiporter [Haloimpatiens sp. FM7330]|uniref:cation:proton antiporter n=1 Tax=Haloimpatiens sp. FM7330 TaxID=3298610 RepID=UPI00362F1184